MIPRLAARGKLLLGTALLFLIVGALHGAPPLVGFPGHFFVELIAYSYSAWMGTALVIATLGVLVAQPEAADAPVEVGRPADVGDAERDAGGMHACLGHHAGAGSIRTPGLSRPRGSTAAFAPRRAAANGSGRWRSYQGRWSRPTA